MDNSEKIKKLVTSYNDFLSNLSYKKDIYGEDYSKEEEEWENTSSDNLDNLSPKALAEDMETDITSENIEELYRYAAENAYWSMPEFVKTILKKFFGKTEEIFLKILNDGEKYIEDKGVENIPNEGIADFEYFISTVRLAPELESDAVDEKIIEMFRKTYEDEQLIDAFENAFIKISEDKVFPLMEDRDISETKKEAVAQALVSSGKKSDEIFMHLKKLFKESEVKELLAMILSDYGDGRAIPVLRRELIKLVELYDRIPANSKDRETVFRIMMIYNNSITALGGNTSDIL